jgi:hypothetical protein
MVGDSGVDADSVSIRKQFLCDGLGSRARNLDECAVCEARC